MLFIRKYGSWAWWMLLLCCYPSPIASWMAHFKPNDLEVNMEKTGQVILLLENLQPSYLQQPQRYSFRLESSSSDFASVIDENASIPIDLINVDTRDWSGPIEVVGHFLGISKITVRLVDSELNTSQLPTDWSNDSSLEVRVVRPERVLDHIFVGSIILLMSLVYINFGAALNMEVLRGLITRPVAPSIGFIMQVVSMPLLSYALGVFIFPQAPAMQLGLFFTGISPSGGASNTWSAVLGGNIDLSVLMTTISNVAAFASMPLWIFTLGQLIFERAGMVVPYGKIATYCVSLVVPLLIGLAIQRCSPRLTRILVRLLKPISASLILFIIIFAIITNFYLFQLFSWQIAAAGFALPALGYAIAWLTAKLLNQNSADALTIAIETGIQNTGIAIFFLRTTLQQPQADLTTVVPVAVAIMTPIPLLGIYLYKRLFGGSKTIDASSLSEHERERIV